MFANCISTCQRMSVKKERCELRWQCLGLTTRLIAQVKRDYELPNAQCPCTGRICLGKTMVSCDYRLLYYVIYHALVCKLLAALCMHMQASLLPQHDGEKFCSKCVLDIVSGSGCCVRGRGKACCSYEGVRRGH